MTTYVIDRSVASGKPRIVSQAALSAADFDSIARALGAAGTPRRARKIGFIAARQATAPERVVTRIEGVETEADAQPGDWIVTNLDRARAILRDRAGAENSYIVRDARFRELYQRDAGVTDFGDVYLAKGVVDAIACPGGFDIVAPWGERQVGADGYLLRNGADVYGIHIDAFRSTYEVLV